MHEDRQFSEALEVLGSIRIDSRQDYVAAGDLLAILSDHMDALTPEQLERATALALEVARYMGRPQSPPAHQ